MTPKLAAPGPPRTNSSGAASSRAIQIGGVHLDVINNG